MSFAGRRSPFLSSSNHVNSFLRSRLAFSPPTLISNRPPDALYLCGQHVTFSDKRHTGVAWNGDFVIITHLPSGDEVPCYEIKSIGEVYSRVAYENQPATSFSVFR